MTKNENSRTGIQLDAAANQVIVLHNPNAGANTKTNRINQLVDSLIELGYPTLLLSDINDAVEAASQFEGQGQLRTVVAAGGDGTASLVANRFSLTTPITIFPLGTENLVSKYLGISNEPKKLAELIHEGVMVYLDAGEANGCLFLVMASCGFDAEVVHQMHRKRKGNITHWSYAKPILNSIRRYKYPVIKIRCFGAGLKKKGRKIKAKWAFIFNMPRYAMGLPIVESADGLDGKLDLCSFRNGNLINGLIYFAGIVFRRHRRFKDTSIIEATRILIESDHEVPYQIDGDPGGHLPLEIKVLPKRLAMLVPRIWATSRNIKIASNNSLNTSQGATT